MQSLHIMQFFSKLFNQSQQVLYFAEKNAINLHSKSIEWVNKASTWQNIIFF